MEIKILGPICEECLALEKALHKAILLKCKYVQQNL